MPKFYSKSPIIETRDIAKQMIDTGDIHFYMRTKKQEQYNPKHMQFSSELDRIAYYLRDMAGLCTSEEVAHYISEIARKITYRNEETQQYGISQEDLDYAVKFIKVGKQEYKNTDYIDLNTLE